MFFGHKHEKFGTTYNRYWGARAIYNQVRDYDIDLLWDRQSTDKVADQPEDEQFLNWLNDRAMPWLREKVKELALAVDDPQEIVLHEFKYELRASTHGSHGYLYIGAVEHPLVECESHINGATNKPERVVEAGGVKFVVDNDFPVGTKGDVTVNGIGPATVVGYYNENYADGLKLACLMVVMENPPDWWIKQTQNRELQKLHLTKREEKAWRNKWKPSPCPIWASDFKPKKVPAWKELVK